MSPHYVIARKYDSGVVHTGADLPDAEHVHLTRQPDGSYTAEAAQRETRYQFERTCEPPEGWVFLHAAFDDKDGSMHHLYADSPDYSPSRKLRWVPTRQVTQERFVTAWLDAPTGGDA
jgi:hypothetical protein